MAPYVIPGMFVLPSNYNTDVAASVEKLVMSILEQAAQWERFLKAGFLRLRVPLEI